ncbi:MAG: hypothetical protein COA73_16180 [Candidatus Hydrogenedentota bacterium]|nr:MAG: hypothetical protein COA73_16180 [Candidatus Hydrogenedentota bacterium]
MYVISMMMLMTGCFTQQNQRNDDMDLFEQGEFLCLEQRWEEARPVLREFLLNNPEHAGAHFYLGRAYLLAEDFRPAIAEGEFQTALHLFQRQGKVLPIERLETPEYFEFICHLDSAKVCYLEFSMRISIGAPPQALQPIAQRGRAHMNAALMLNTVPADYEMWDTNIRMIEQASGLLPRQRPSSSRNAAVH